MQPVARQELRNQVFLAFLPTSRCPQQWPQGPGLLALPPLAPRGYQRVGFYCAVALTVVNRSVSRSFLIARIELHCLVWRWVRSMALRTTAENHKMTTLTTVILAMLSINPLGSGTHTRELTVDGRSRRYVVYVPERRPDGRPWPVVLAFHGGGTNAEIMMRFSGLNEKAAEAGFLAVYPDGTGRLERMLTWNGGNCCGYAQRKKVDDVKFVGAVLDDLKTALPIDPNRVFATGMSNGAILCYLLASQMADRIAAIAPVSGTMGTATCAPCRPVSVCHFHGTQDDFLPYQGGLAKRSLTRTRFYSVEHSIRAWVRANGCNPEGKTTVLPDQADDGMRVVRTVYSGGKDDTEVVLYTIEGGGHTWPGRPSRLEYLGPCTRDISANDVIWDFFLRHGRKKRS